MIDVKENRRLYDLRQTDYATPSGFQSHKILAI